MDKGLIKEFAAMFDEQAGLYLKLKETALAQAAQLEAKNIALFEKATASQEELISGISALENEKQVIFKKLCSDAGYAAGSAVTLDALESKMDKESSAVIKAAVLKLFSAVKDAEAVNAKNMRTVKNYIDYVKFAAEKNTGPISGPGKNNFDKTV